MILGQDDESHIIAEHRSGTPPHNYQFLLRVRLDKPEMDQYCDILKDSKTLPAFTTIYFDQTGKQLDRTFFCLQDLPKIFGREKKKDDEFDRLFPIRASLQKNPDHEGGFDIVKSVARGKSVSIDRDDFELLVYRYLPAYLPQDTLRKTIQENRATVFPLLSHAPLFASELTATAAGHRSYMKSEGAIESASGTCPKNYYLPNTPVPETIHSFMLMGEVAKNTVLAVHYYDRAPQNFQTALRIVLSNAEMSVYREAKKGTSVPPLFVTRESKDRASYFCMENIRALVKAGAFEMDGVVYRDSDLNDFKLGTVVGKLAVPARSIEVMVNRRLESFMDPIAVAADVARSPKSAKAKAASPAASTGGY